VCVCTYARCGGGPQNGSRRRRRRKQPSLINEFAESTRLLFV